MELFGLLAVVDCRTGRGCGPIGVRGLTSLLDMERR